MSLWSKLKEIFRKMIGPKTVESVLHITPTISSEMSDAIQLWSDMYEDKSPWLREPTKDSPVRIVSLGLPALIASEKARMATLEMEAEINAPMEEVEEANPDYIPPSIDPNTGMPTMGHGQMTIKKDVPKGNTERADFLSDQFDKVRKQIRRQLEYGIAKGGLVIKPYPVFDDTSKFTRSTTNDKDINEDEKTAVGTKKDTPRSTLQSDNVIDKEKKDYGAQIEFDFVQADGFYPLSFNASGKVTEAAFVQRKVEKDVIYSRVEYHKLEGKRCTIMNFAFKALNTVEANNVNNLDTDLGSPISLKEVSDWAALEEKTVIEGVDRLLFAYFKMPEANTIDTYSPLGVSGYSRVINLIKDADYQYSRLLWEYEGGELAIDIDRDALKLVQDKQGNDLTVRPMAQERLFRKIDLNSEETYNVFSPTLRDQSILNGLNSILVRIEDSTGMSRGTISNSPISEAKTATELKILRQRSYATNADIQSALEDALKDVIYIMDVYCNLYDITPEGEYECSFEWDDSILVDIETELSKRLTLMQNGLASKLETRMWYFNETENQAKAALQKIDEEAKQAIETNMMAQSQLGAQAQNQQSGMFSQQNISNPNNGVHATREQMAKNMTKPEDKNTKDDDNSDSTITKVNKY